MTSTVFTDNSTVIVAAWLNDVNTVTYTTVPSHTTTLASGVVLKDSSTGAASLPVGTTGQRPGTPVQGQFRYNTTTPGWEGYNGVTWASISSTDFLNSTRIDVVSATTTDLTALAPNTRNINITGTTTITGFTVAIGQTYIVRFAAALTLTNSASLVTQTGANVITDAGATCLLRSTAANTVELISYTSGAGSVSLSGNQTIAGTKTFTSTPVFPTQSMVRVNTRNGYGSTSTQIARFTNITNGVNGCVIQGTDITFADSSTLGSTFTINTSGVYGISFTDTCGAATGFFGISLNSSQLTTAVGSISVSDRLSLGLIPAANTAQTVATIVYLSAGAVIRPHADSSSGTSATLDRSSFTITRIA